VLTDNLNGTWSYMPAADDDTSVTFSYTASDGEFSASSTASLDLTPVNDAPTITAPNGGAPVTVSVAENTTAVADVDANDPDAGDMLAYSIVETAGTDFDKFAINSAGILTFLVAPDFELPADVGGIAGDNIYVVEVQVADGQGGFDTQTISVEVSNVNEGPVAVGDNIFTTDTTEVPFGKWLLLYNDYDPEGDPIDVTNVGGATGFVFITPPTLPSNYLAIHDNSAPFNYGTFTYQATDGTTPGNVATVNVGLSATGTSGDDILIGNNAGSDLLNGGDGNDILIGQSLGFDTLQGGNGDDLYAFQTVNLGLGAQNTDSGDTIIDTSGTDTIAFATFGSSFGDSFLPFTVYRPDVSTGSFNHLVFSNGGHTIVNFRAVVSNHFAGNPIEKIQFVGGAQLKGYALAATPYTLLANTALAPLNGTSGNDFMVGIYLLNNVFNAVGEELNGGDGDDVIMGNAGIDILRGGAGNDFLVGGTENNTFVFDLTDGHDMVSDNEFNNLYVFNTNGIAFTQFEFERVQDAWPSTSTTESDLVFRYEGQSIQIQEFSSMPVGRIQFAGGASVHGYDLGGGVYTFVGLVGASAGAELPRRHGWCRLPWNDLVSNRLRRKRRALWARRR
jgi:Ca2+-binding RTX toxin-like protein